MSERMIIEPRALDGAAVRLEPVGEAHREGMRAALDCDAKTWGIYSVAGFGAHFPAFWDAMTGTPGRIAYAVVDKASGRIAGTSSFFLIDPDHRTLEIGYTWLHPDFRGTRANPEAKLLMLSEAFGAGALRVQFGVDARNARSQAAVLKLGAAKEGVVRRHKITWTGHKRDTALFSIVEEEWPEVERRLKERLA